MPLCNRVTPFGELIRDPARGLVYGNRGCLHDAAGEIRRPYAVRRWIACRLEFKGRRRSPLVVPGRYTELFFLDEATAFAAGHRPCAECRREDYNRLSEVWRALHPGPAGADAIDDVLHAERWDPDARRPRRHPLPFADLPDGTFAVDDERAWLVRGDRLLEWTPAGYLAARRSRPRDGTVTVLTPPSLVEVLRSGWQGDVPLLHPTADATAEAPPLAQDDAAGGGVGDELSV